MGITKNNNLRSLCSRRNRSASVAQLCFLVTELDLDSSSCGNRQYLSVGHRHCSFQCFPGTGIFLRVFASCGPGWKNGQQLVRNL